MTKIPESQNTTVNAIYKSYEAKQQRERTYLGCSQFGVECDRALWYTFRWADEPEKFSGRMLRLFETGHSQEARMIVDLERIGIDVDYVENDQQFMVSALGGHLQGHLDGVVKGVVEAPKTKHVLECKTHNDKSFKDLLVNRVKKSKPGQYAQMQLYMHLGGYERALYMAVNKNDDSLYIERVKLDPKEVTRLMNRAMRIIGSDRAPPKISEDRDSFACMWCSHKEICHDKMMPERRNCRTCISAVVHPEGEGGEWSCTFWKKFLTAAEQKAGCDKHLYLPSLMPGKQVDADEENRTITYEMKDGKVVIVDTVDGWRLG